MVMEDRWKSMEHALLKCETITPGCFSGEEVVSFRINLPKTQESLEGVRLWEFRHFDKKINSFMYSNFIANEYLNVENKTMKVGITRENEYILAHIPTAEFPHPIPVHGEDVVFV